MCPCDAWTLYVDLCPWWLTLLVSPTPAHGPSKATVSGKRIWTSLASCPCSLISTVSSYTFRVIQTRLLYYFSQAMSSDLLGWVGRCWIWVIALVFRYSLFNQNQPAKPTATQIVYSMVYSSFRDNSRGGRSYPQCVLVFRWVSKPSLLSPIAQIIAEMATTHIECCSCLTRQTLETKRQLPILMPASSFCRLKCFPMTLNTLIVNPI